MKFNIFLLIVATVIVVINCAQIKSAGREWRHPTRDPQGLYPDGKGSLTRTYRNAREDYKFDESLIKDETVPRDDRFVKSKLELLKIAEAKKMMEIEESKLKALMTNDIDDDDGFQTKN
uniref:Uncharacterized protein n=1 Tax=Pristhesancus plagipennis TaxID=1955184 RepID=A0A2K8JMW1_PRIPG|nr:secreted hypothetical protein [Pristhesancus plagipennis]